MSQILYIVNLRKKNEPSYITKNTQFMKTKSFFSLVLIAMSFTLMSFSPMDYEKTDWSKYELKGKVKELTINTYSAHRYFGVVEKLDNYRPKTIVVKFSSNGKILEESDISDNNYKEKITYVYDRNKTIINRYANGDLLQRYIIEYNEFGKIKAITYYNSADSKGDRTEYVYNDKKQLVTIIYSNQSKTEYEYDQSGRVGITNSYSSSGVLNRIIRYYYDEKGNVNKKEYLLDGEISSYYILTYTPEGFPEMRNMYYSKDNQLKYSHTYSYRFDTKGNYTKKSSSEITYSEGKEEETCSIEERTIVYY